MFESQLTLGTLPGDDSTSFRITEGLLKTHLAIFGGTRFGKSKLIELICRELIVNRRGFAFIDPHSDTADDLLAFVCAHAEEFPFIKRKIHYLRPGDRLFSFDPFIYRPDPDDAREHTEYAYRSWLHGKIKDMAKIICRQQGDTEDEAQKMVRLRRWLYNVLYAVGVRQNPEGTHLPLSDAFILLNPSHPDHQEVYSLVEPVLSDEVRADFEKLRRTRDARKQEEWIESTMNRLRDILSPTMQCIFNVRNPSIDLAGIIQRGDILLASLGKTKFFHEDEAMAVAGLLIREISEAVRTFNRSEREQFYLFIDEAHNFLGDDLIRLLKESAKYKLSFGLAVQGLDNLQKGEIDMVPAVLGQCGIRITFRQQFHEHAEALAKSLCYPMLDFAELQHEVDRDDGYDWVWTPSTSEGEGETVGLQWGVTHSTSVSDGESQSIGTTEGSSESIAHSTSQSDTITKGKSTAMTDGTNRQRSLSLGESRSAGTSHGESSQVTEGRSTSRGVTSGQTQSESTSANEMRSRSSSESRSEGIHRSYGESRGESRSHGVTDHDGGDQSTSESDGRSVSRQESRGYSENRGSSHGTSEGSSKGTTTGSSTSESQSFQEGTSSSRGHGTQQSQSQAKSESEQLGLAEGDMKSFTRGTSESVARMVGQGTTRTKSRSTSTSKSYSRSHTEGSGTADSKSESFGKSRNKSVTFQLTPLHKTRAELQRTGQLQVSVNDQFAKQAATISSLAKQECLVAIAAFNSTVVLRVADVRDPFEESLMSPKWQKLAIDRLKQEVFSALPYYIDPSDQQLLAERRKREFLKTSVRGNIAPPAGEPII